MVGVVVIVVADVVMATKVVVGVFQIVNGMDGVDANARNPIIEAGMVVQVGDGGIVGRADVHVVVEVVMGPGMGLVDGVDANDWNPIIGVGAVMVVQVGDCGIVGGADEMVVVGDGVTIAGRIDVVVVVPVRVVGAVGMDVVVGHGLPLVDVVAMVTRG